MHKKIDITKLTFSSKRLPNAFDGCRILQISDLHNNFYGKGQKRLIKITKYLKPEYIFITGDMIDQYHNGMDKACEYIKGISKIAPIYYVTGNHEWVIGKMRNDFLGFLKEQGVTILRDEILTLQREDSTIQLLGMDDPYKRFTKHGWDNEKYYSMEFLRCFFNLNKKRSDAFTVLLSHRPEFINYYSRAKVDLVFSGHAHGGQFRLPFIGGILSPHQGFFPKYAEGMIYRDKTCMVVSRGLGDSAFPIRLGNPPEMILLTMRTGE